MTDEYAVYFYEHGAWSPSASLKVLSVDGDKATLSFPLGLVPLDNVKDDLKKKEEDKNAQLKEITEALIRNKDESEKAIDADEPLDSIGKLAIERRQLKRKIEELNSTEYETIIVATINEVFTIERFNNLVYFVNKKLDQVPVLHKKEHLRVKTKKQKTS